MGHKRKARELSQADGDESHHRQKRVRAHSSQQGGTQVTTIDDQGATLEASKTQHSKTRDSKVEEDNFNLDLSPVSTPRWFRRPDRLLISEQSELEHIDSVEEDK